jgi:hypothetical protein
VTSAPHWLGSAPLRNLRVKQHRLVWPDGRPHASALPPSGQAPLLPALSSPDAGAIKADQRRFRVVEGGRPTGKYDKG